MSTGRLLQQRVSTALELRRAPGKAEAKGGPPLQCTSFVEVAAAARRELR